MKKKETTTGRRGFLRGVFAAGSGVAVAATAGKLIEPETAAAASGSEDETGRGYHLSTHIKNYYDSAAF